MTDVDRERALQGLLARLAAEQGIPTIAADELDARAATEPSFAVLLTAAKSPESWDVAVVLPEVVRSCPGVRAVALEPAESAKLAARFGIDKYPSVVVLREGFDEQ